MTLDHFLYFIYGYATCALLVVWRLWVWHRKIKKASTRLTRNDHGQN